MSKFFQIFLSAQTIQKIECTNENSHCDLRNIYDKLYYYA